MTVEADITLISVTGRVVDAYGIPQDANYTLRTVLCDVRSAGRSEFYQAAQAGFKPELEATLFFDDYQDEPFAQYDGIVYKVIRTYRSDRDYKTSMSEADSDRITLTLEKNIGGGPFPALSDVTVEDEVADDG